MAVPRLIKKGKVRDLYDLGNNQILIYHSDRLSSFDKIWCEIQGKGKVLCSTSLMWFHDTSNIIPNHMIQSIYDSPFMIVKRCNVFPIEFVVRGYITGTTNTSLWTHYSKGERIYCGVEFPDGLQKNQKLPEVVITPTTKGEIDEPLTPSEIIERNLMTQKEWEYCSAKALELFQYGQKVANERGLILVDTKYEFGRDAETNQILLIDEIHTCDSSRYWKADTYEDRFQKGREPDRYDKDIIRTYIKSQCDPYETLPDDLTIPESMKLKVQNAYEEFYKTLSELPLCKTPFDDMDPIQVGSMYMNT